MNKIINHMHSVSKASEQVTLNQWLNSGLQGGKADKRQGSEKIVVPEFVNGKRIENTLR